MTALADIPKPQKSPNWDRRSERIIPNSEFPFNEGWPDVDKTHSQFFTIILQDGQRVIARVDFSTQYRAEGLQWLTNDGKLIDKTSVAAWKEKRSIVITEYSTYKSAGCEECKWITVDKKRLMDNVREHQKRHDPAPGITHRKADSLKK